MSELKAISIDKTIDVSNRKLPRYFVSKSGQHITNNKYPAIDSFFNENAMVCLLYLSNQYRDGVGYSLLFDTKGFNIWEWPLVDLNDVGVSMMIREYSEKIQTACYCESKTSEKFESSKFEIDSLFDAFRYLIQLDEHTFGRSKHIESIKIESSMQEIAALELACYDKLFEYVLQNDLLSINRYVRLFDCIADFYHSCESLSNRQIISRHARKVGRKARSRFAKGKSQAQEVARTRYFENGETISTMALARELNGPKGLLETIHGVEDTPDDATVNRWIKEVAPEGVNKRGRPRKK